jgi:hypothetical protein
MADSKEQPRGTCVGMRKELYTFELGMVVMSWIHNSDTVYTQGHIAHCNDNPAHRRHHLGVALDDMASIMLRDFPGARQLEIGFNRYVNPGLIGLFNGVRDIKLDEHEFRAGRLMLEVDERARVLFRPERGQAYWHFSRPGPSRPFTPPTNFQTAPVSSPSPLPAAVPA